MLTGAAAVNGSGNELENGIVGNSAANKLASVGGNDDLFGGGGNDTIDGGAGLDSLIGAAGNDLLTGGADRDFFVRLAATDGKDTITDFQVGAGGDALDIGEVLVGFQPGTSDADDFVQAVFANSNTTIRIDANGAVGGANFVDAFVLQGVNTTVDQLVAGNNLILVDLPS